MLLLLLLLLLILFLWAICIYKAATVSISADEAYTYNRSVSVPIPDLWFTIVGESDWQAYAELGASQIRRGLETIGMSAADIAQVRLTRWGHAMPFAQPGQIADGLAETVRRPIAERIWFVNQDNWLLPAVETCLEEAFSFTDAIRSRLES